MKVQYFGDVNDYRKFALIRLLSEDGQFKIGVCWMLTPDDGSGHGGKRSYRRQPEKWRAFDPLLFDALVRAPARPTIDDLQRVENEALISGATFFNKIAPDALAGRAAYHASCMKALESCDMIFFDPDNGLEIKSVAKGRKSSSKYVFLDEVADHYSAGRSVLLYQHFPRLVARETFIGATVQRLRAPLAEATVWRLDTPHVVFLLVAGPNHVDRMKTITEAVDQRGWMPELFSRVEAV